MQFRRGVAIWGLVFTLAILCLAVSGETGNGPPAGWSFTLPDGDPLAGGVVFTRLGCPGCHRMAGRSFRQIGAESIAPEFDAARARLPREYLAESILNPHTDMLSCDRVLASPYAEIGGVPVALIGLAGFGGLCLLGLWRLRWGARSPDWLPGATVVMAGTGLLFEAGMTGIELFVIGALCPCCLAAFGLIVAAFVSAVMVRHDSSGPRLGEAALA
jgi:uncharacterized membrane protein